MSKFLKFIVNLVVLLVIVIALALMVPQFLGVETVMNDNTDTETNLPTGSVAYGRNVNVGELKEGDRIIYSEGAQTYVYEITEMDTSAGSYQVRDVYSAQSGDTTVKLTKNVAKVVLVVPFIGYAAIALQTTEGLIVVGLGVVFLVILFILSELWRKDKYDDEEEEEEEQGSEDSGEEEEEILTRKERRRLKKEEKRRRKLERKGYDDEEEEIFRVSENAFTVDGSTSIDEIEDLLDVDLPEGDYDTIAGMVVELLGRIPKPGEHPTVTWENLTFTVEEVEERRISKLLIVKDPEYQKEKEDKDEKED